MYPPSWRLGFLIIRVLVSSESLQHPASLCNWFIFLVSNGLFYPSHRLLALIPTYPTSKTSDSHTGVEVFNCQPNYLDCLSCLQERKHCLLPGFTLPGLQSAPPIHLPLHFQLSCFKIFLPHSTLSYRKNAARWFTSVIPALWRLRQEDSHVFKSSLGLTENFKPAWASVRSSLKTKGRCRKRKIAESFSSSSRNPRPPAISTM